MSYVDGYVIPIKKENVPAYKKMAQWGKKTWIKHGALQYFECVGEDLKVKKNAGQGFTKMAKLKRGETVIFAFVIFKSRKHRDEVNKAVMQVMKKMMTPKQAQECAEIMDMKRFAYGGFKTIVQA
jgi:uncharacterized protein YbaA (DUF1428 family)